MKIGILGGGITGITLGKLLDESRYEIEILEAESKIGGLCRTEIKNGFVFDIGGGHIIYSRDRAILNFMLEVLGNEKIQHVRNTKIFYKGNYIKYPFENGLCGLSKEDNYECVIGFIDAYLACKSGKSEDPKNFKEWIMCKFGEGIARKFMYPFNEKMWKTDLSKMGVDWVNGRVPIAPVQDVVKSSLGIETEGYTQQSIFYYPLKGGILALVERMAEKIKKYIKVNTPVTEIEKKKNGWIANGREYDQIISTIPIQELFKALKSVPSTVKDAVNNLTYNSIATFLVGVDKTNVKPYSWVYLPHKENGYCNRVTYLSNYSPNNAPNGKGSILAEVTYPGRTDLEVDDDYVDVIINSLHKNGMIDKNSVCCKEWRKVKYAYVVHDVNYRKNIRRVHDYLSKIGIKFLGRFAEFKYINMDVCIKKAIGLAREITREKSRCAHL